MKPNTDVEKIISSLKRWQMEASSFRNDGWVQEHYKDLIKKVFVESGKTLREINVSFSDF